MTGTRKFVITLPVLLAALVAYACGDSAGPSPDDAGNDAGPDVTTSDAAPDARPDATQDAGADTTSVDAGTDAFDAPNEATPDADTDASIPPALWSKGFVVGGPYTDLQSLAVDSAGNVVIVGYFQGTVDFGGGVLTATGAQNSDAFVAKLDPTGNHLWSKAFGDAESQIAYGVSIDAAGNVYVTGANSGTIDFGVGAPIVSTGQEDIFVAKLDPAGNALWARGFGDPGNQAGYAIAAEKSGGAVVTGYMAGTVNFGQGALTSAGQNDVFVLRVDASGATAWAKRYGGLLDDYGTSIALDPTGGGTGIGDAGVDAAADASHDAATDAAADAAAAVESRVVFTGDFDDTIDFGTGPLATAGLHDAFLVKLGGDGVTLFAKRYGDSDQQLGDSVAFDSAGNIVYGGSYSGTIDLGLGALQSGGTGTTGAKFLAKLDPSGTTLWNKSYGTSGVYDWTSVAADPSGRVISTGEFQTAIDFGGGTLFAKNGYDVFLASFTPAGALVWGRAYGGMMDQLARSVGTDSSGNVFVGGAFDGAINFGNGPIKAVGGTNLFLAKLGPS